MSRQQRVNDLNEKRKHPRLKLSLPLFCYGLTSRFSFYSEFENINIGGIGLVNIRFLSLDELLKLKLEFPGRTVRCKGKIIWLKNLPDSEDKKAGVKFTSLESKSRDFIADFISDQTVSHSYQS